MSSVLLAVGGNALVTEDEKPTIDAQIDRVKEIAETIVELVEAGHSVTVTHGNGPQVGFIMRRAELLTNHPLATEIPRLPLWLAVADSQGGIGHLLATALHTRFRARGMCRPVSALLTHCVVDPNDPAFERPDKPIGTLMPPEDADPSWTTISPRPGLVRRVVASPHPRDIVESEAIDTLMRAGQVVIAGGGGGIPVVYDERGMRGVDAVIDKDRTSALLANQAHIDTLVLLTGVEAVAVEWGTKNERALRHVSADEMRTHLAAGQFPAGSMGPKIEAALAFLDQGGKRVIITNIPTVADALAGRGGTTITQEKP